MASVLYHSHMSQQVIFNRFSQQACTHSLLELLFDIYYYTLKKTLNY